MLELPIAPRRFAVVRAPSGLGLRAAGVEGLGDAILGHGLARALDARITAIVAPPAASGIRDPESGVLNARRGCRVRCRTRRCGRDGARRRRGAARARRRLQRVARRGARVAPTSRRRAPVPRWAGRLCRASAEPSGEAASMDVALATGFGQSAVGDLEGRAPLFRAEDAVVAGFRDVEAREGSQRFPARSSRSTSPRCARLAPPRRPRAPSRTLPARAPQSSSGSMSTPTYSPTRLCPWWTTASPVACPRMILRLSCRRDCHRPCRRCRGDDLQPSTRPRRNRRRWFERRACTRARARRLLIPDRNRIAA